MSNPGENYWRNITEYNNTLRENAHSVITQRLFSTLGAAIRFHVSAWVPETGEKARHLIATVENRIVRQLYRVAHGGDIPSILEIDGLVGNDKCTTLMYYPHMQRLRVIEKLVEPDAEYDMLHKPPQQLISPVDAHFTMLHDELQRGASGAFDITPE